MKFNIMVVVIIFLLSSCDNKSKNPEIDDMVNSWVGKRLEIPKDLQQKNLNSSEKLKAFNEYNNKVIVYIDSSGCVDCKLALQEWKLKIRQLQEYKDDMCFLFIINSGDYKIVESLFLRESFNYPIFFDYKDEFNKKNNLPDNYKYHVFLVDNNNEVILIGSPISNEKLWNVYKSVIVGD